VDFLLVLLNDILSFATQGNEGLQSFRWQENNLKGRNNMAWNESKFYLIIVN